MKTFTSFHELDMLGEGLSKEYIKQTHGWDSACFDIEGFITEYLGLTIVYESFAECDKSKIGFLADGNYPLVICRNKKKLSVVFPKDTIVIDKYLLREEESARKRFTLAHEAAHKIISLHVPQSVASFHSSFDVEQKYSAEEIRQMFSLKETYANRLAAAILMPSFLVKKALDKYNNGEKIKCFGGMVLAPEVKLNVQVMADSLGVSYSAFINRLRETSHLDVRPLSEYITESLRLGSDL